MTSANVLNRLDVLPVWPKTVHGWAGGAAAG